MIKILSWPDLQVMALEGDKVFNDLMPLGSNEFCNVHQSCGDDSRNQPRWGPSGREPDELYQTLQGDPKYRHIRIICEVCGVAKYEDYKD